MISITLLINVIILISHLSTIHTFVNKPNPLKPTNCVIKNVEYEDDFLYTCKQYPSYSNDHRRKVYTNPISPKYMDSTLQTRWLFIPVTDDGTHSNDTYYIVNEQYKEFLCSAGDHLEITKRRRKVNTLSINEIENEDECMWRLDESKTKIQNYIIWNVRYKEALYAASSLLMTMKSNRRNVFTWYKTPDSKQFNWVIFCFQRASHLLPFQSE